MTSSTYSEIEITILHTFGLPVKSRYNVRELATSLSVPEKTVYGWHYTRRYDAEKLGGKRYFPLHTVIKILSDSTVL